MRWMDFPSFVGMVLCCKEWQPGGLPVLQGELSVLARLTGQTVLSKELNLFSSTIRLMLSLWSSCVTGPEV